MLMDFVHQNLDDKGSLSFLSLFSAWDLVERLKRVTGTTGRHQRFHAWRFCWQIPGIQSGLCWNIYKWTLHRSQFDLLGQNWIPRPTMPKNKAGVHSILIFYPGKSQCCFCHTLLVMAMTKSHPCSRTRDTESNTQWKSWTHCKKTMWTGRYHCSSLGESHN